MNSNFDAKGYYYILKVTPNAPLSLIKQQYYKCAKYWHPDHNDDPNAVEIFQKISVAYNVLKDQRNRLKYDLLSLVYTDKDFPEMDSLKIYKNQKGKDDAALRVLKQRKVLACLHGFRIKETKDICNYSEAKDMVLTTSISNWLRGWWGIQSFNENIKAISYNLAMSEANDKDNFKLLIHNAVAYDNAGNINMAWIYAKQAQQMAINENRAVELLQTYLDILDFHPQKKIKLPKWSAQELKFRQMILPAFLGMVVCVFCFAFFKNIGLISMPTHQNSGYYTETVIGGVRVADDQVETRIIKIDGSEADDAVFYHLKEDGEIYYGPDSRYDVLLKGVKGQTVRLAGYTPDKNWFKIIIDNGEAGYINRKNLEKGIGIPIPVRSKVK